MIFRTLGDAYSHLSEAGISVDYDKHKDVAQNVISRKNELQEILRNTIKFQNLYEMAQNTPHLYTKKDNQDLEHVVSYLSNRPLLTWAIINKKEKDLINFFIEKGADLNAKNSKDWIGTPLHYTVEYKEIEIAELLLKNGADINSRNHFLKNTPLHSAVLQEKTDFINLFLDNGSDVNVKDYSGRTPMYYAAGTSFEIFNLLLNHGADLDAKTNDDETLLHSAALLGDFKIIQFLLEKDLNVNAKNNEGFSPLHYAALGNNIHAIHLLLETGADIDAQNHKGKTPIYCAIQFANIDRVAIPVIQLLLDQGAKTDPIEELLYLALENKRIDIFDLLINHQIDLELKNK